VKAVVRYDSSGVLVIQRLSVGDSALPVASPDGMALLNAFLEHDRNSVVFAVPSERVTFLERTVERAERKLLAQSLPYSLEERLAEDVDELHFAHRWLSEERIAVSVIRKSVLEEYQQEPAIAALSHWIPDVLLLPSNTGQWVIVVEQDRCLARLSDSQAFVCHPNLLDTFLASSLAEGSPAAVSIYLDQQAEMPEMSTALPVAPLVRKGSWTDAVLMGEGVLDSLNIRQGTFVAQLPWFEWWTQWRWVAACVLGALVLQGTVTYADLTLAQAQNLDLRRAIETTYRQVSPQGALVDPEKQLERQLRALRGDGQRTGFIELLSRTGAVLNGVDQTQIVTINYSDRNEQLGLTVTVADFESVEKIRSELVKAQLTVDIENSTQSGDGVRARLRVGR
jgi:general secretion pathway protein L